MSDLVTACQDYADTLASRDKFRYMLGKTPADEERAHRGVLAVVAVEIRLAVADASRDEIADALVKYEAREIREIILAALHRRKPTGGQ